MSIARRQIIAVTNKILEEAFKEGVILTVNQVVEKVYEQLKDNWIGRPITKYRPAPYRGRSNPDDWNATIDELDTDLKVLFDETVDQSQRILTDFDYFEIEKRRLERNIGELEDEIEELLLLDNNTDGYLYSVFDNFRNMSLVDTDNTSAWIDFTGNFVTLPQAKAGNAKIDLSSVQISGELLTKNNIVSSTTLESLSNIVDDNINTSWIQKITTNKQIEVVYQVTIQLSGEPTTRLIINPHVPAKTRFQIQYTEDDKNWYTLGDQIGVENMVFDHDLAKLKGIRLIMSKSIHDETEAAPDNQQNYIYYFGITNINVLKIGYEDIAVFQTKPLEILDRQGHPVEIDKISIQTTEEVPVGTQINYYIALQKKGASTSDPINWQPISPYDKQNASYPKYISLKSMSSTHNIDGLMASSATQYTEGANTLFNGLRFYKLNDSSIFPYGTKIIRGASTPNLYKGIKQFRVETYKLNHPEGAVFHMPSPLDWTNLPVDPITKQSAVIRTKFIEIGSTFHLNAEEEQYAYRISTSEYVKDATTFASSLSIVNPSISSAQVNVMVLVNGLPVVTNGILKKGLPISVNWKFVSGWNTITLLLFKVDGASLDIRFHNQGTEPNPFTISNTVQVDQQPMIYVPLFEYLYNTFEKEIDKYSVTDNNEIIISEYQKSQGGRYAFSYNYVIDQGYANIVRFKAELSRESNPNVTPKLLYYKLRVT